MRGPEERVRTVGQSAVNEIESGVLVEVRDKLMRRDLFEEFCRRRQAVQNLNLPAARRAVRAVRIVHVLDGDWVWGDRPPNRRPQALDRLRSRDDVFAVDVFADFVFRRQAPADV
jgi:hypothetical protein